MSKAGKALSRALDRASEWDLSNGYRAIHNPSGTHWWTANGGFFFDGESDTNRCLGIIERHFLYYKLKKMIQNKVALELEAKA